jgi:hypothetical protein
VEEGAGTQRTDGRTSRDPAMVAPAASSIKPIDQHDALSDDSLPNNIIEYKSACTQCPTYEHDQEKPIVVVVLGLSSFKDNVLEQY